MAKLPSSRILKAGDDLAPDFAIEITGKSAANAAPLFEAIRPLVASVVYEEDEEMSAQLEITVINRPDENATGTTGKGFADWTKVIDSKVFQEGNYIDLNMGYGGVQTFMGRTEIVKWLPQFGADGPTEFVIKGHDARHRMMVGNEYRIKQSGRHRKRKTFYSNLTDDLIIKRIAGKYGFAVNTDTPDLKRHTVKGKLASRVQPSDMTDWNFLRKLADINRFDLWVDFDTIKNQFVINFKKRKTAGSAEFLFFYNGRDGSLIEASPDFAIQEQATDIEVLYFDRKKQAIERTVISDTNTSENVKLTGASPGNLTAKKTMTLAARVRFSAFGQVIEAFHTKPFPNKSEAQNFVKNWLKERERDFLVLRGKVVGVETLRPRQIHEIGGLSTRIDGFYRFTQVRHIMQPGPIYTCEFIAHKVLSQDLTTRKATTKVQTTASSISAG